MMFKIGMTQSQMLTYAVAQAREAAITLGICVYIHAVGDKYLVDSNSQQDFIAMILPNLDVLWRLGMSEVECA